MALSRSGRTATRRPVSASVMCRSCGPCGARSRPPRAPAVSRSRAQAGGGSTAAASTCSPQPPDPGTSGRRGGQPASPPRAPAPSAGRCCVFRAGRSVRRPARQTSPACRKFDHSGNAAPVTRSAPGARRPRCRRADVRIGCGPGTTVSHTPDTQPARQQPWPALPPTRRQARRFRSRHLRPGGTTGPGGEHHPRPFMIAVSVTLRGPSTESDPEPRFSRRRQGRARNEMARKALGWQSCWGWWDGTGPTLWPLVEERVRCDGIHGIRKVLKRSATEFAVIRRRWCGVLPG